MISDDLFPAEGLDLIREVNASFQRVKNLWQSYCQTTKWEEMHHADLAGEVSRRLSQLEFIFYRVVELERISRVNGNKMLQFVMKNKRQAPNDLLNEDSKVGFEVELFTESFYYFFFRLISIITRITGIKRIKENSKGIVLVRNLLIEHPEQIDSHIFNHSFAHVGPYGPAVKNARLSNQIDKFQDPGLYRNAKEMLLEIEASLKAR